MNMNNIRAEMNANLSFYNKYKMGVGSQTIIGSIVNVNEEKFSVDVFVPSTSSKINNVIIGIGALSESDTTISLLPTKGQKGVVLMSSQHPPILIATIPNKRTENRSSLLSGELLLGNKNAMIKIAKDNSSTIKSPNSIFTVKDNFQRIISKNRSIKSPGYLKEEGSSNFGYSEEIYHEIENKDFRCSKSELVNNSLINEELKAKVMSDGQSLLANLFNMLDIVKSTNEKINLGDTESVTLLKELRENINSFGYKKGSKRLRILKGRRGESNHLFKVSLAFDNEEKSSLEFNEDGKIVFNCKDLIVNKGDD